MPQFTIGNQLGLVQLGSNAGGSLNGPLAVPRGAVSVAPLDGSRAVISVPTGNSRPSASGVDYRAVAAPAVIQTDLLDISGIAAGASLVVDLGEVHAFLDLGAVPLVVAEVQVIDPNGVPHDLFTWTIDKSTGDGFLASLPTLAPGRYTFTNISGGALTTDGIYVRHTGARNLA